MSNVGWLIGCVKHTASADSIYFIRRGAWISKETYSVGISLVSMVVFLFTETFVRQTSVCVVQCDGACACVTSGGLPWCAELHLEPLVLCYTVEFG
jgi:hypothetical protein